MTTQTKTFFQNPNTGTPMVMTIGATGNVCLFVEGDATETDQDAADLAGWRAFAESNDVGRGQTALRIMSRMLARAGADLS